MSIDDKLDAIISSNPRITDKVWFKQNLQFIKEIYSYYDVNYDFSNIFDIIRTLDIKNTDENISVYYDAKNNSIVRGISSENLYFDLCKTFLEMSSQSYDLQKNRYNRGLIEYDENGEPYQNTVDFNNYVISSLITNTTGLSKDEFDTTQEIILSNYLKDITDEIGAKALVAHFAYGKGNQYYTSNTEEIKKGM